LDLGHHVSLVAFNHNHRPICTETTITDITSVTIPCSPTPRFRAINFEAITLSTPLAQQCSSGVIADADGRVRGLWLSFLGERTANGHDNEYHLGIHVHVFKSILEDLKNFKTPVIRGFPIETVPVQMSQARHMVILSLFFVFQIIANKKEKIIRSSYVILIFFKFFL